MAATAPPPRRDPLTGEAYEAHARAVINRVRPYTMVAYIGLVSLYKQVVHCETHGIGGALVECGVWQGGCCALMAAANLHHATQRRHLHLFDAFDDICEPDAAVDGDAAIRLVKQLASDAGTEGRLTPIKGIYDAKGGAGCVDDCRALLAHEIGYDPAFTHFYQGWFQNTVPPAAAHVDDIALLRLDGDWYASTKVCLDHLFDRVVPGGFVVIDDYGAYDGCRKAVDEFRTRHGLTQYLHDVNADIRYFIK